MQKSRSWSSAHDWKSCKGHKLFEGSNPSFCAEKATVISSEVAVAFFIDYNGCFVILWICVSVILHPGNNGIHQPVLN